MKKNILLIDDSALMRKVLSDIINKDDRFQTAGTAVDGLEALQMLQKDSSRYDALILDINMPKMNGLQLMEELNRQHIKVTILIVSTLALQGAAETIRALELGAFDFVTKPTSFIEAKGEGFEKIIIRMLAAAVGLETADRRETCKTPGKQKEHVAVPVKKSPVRHSNRPENRIVALACSTGGPKALQSIIPYLPLNLNAPFLVVQHMPAGFTNSLAMRLNEISAVRVREAKDGDILQNGTVYIAKGGRHMRIQQNAPGSSQILLTDEPPRNGLKPCADLMYESLKDSSYDEIICTVLTGMGGDGTAGIRALNETNKIKVIAQDEKTSVVYGMPKVVYESGLVDQVLPLDQIAGAIIKYVGVL